MFDNTDSDDYTVDDYNASNRYSDSYSQTSFYVASLDDSMILQNYVSSSDNTVSSEDIVWCQLKRGGNNRKMYIYDSSSNNSSSSNTWTQKRSKRIGKKKQNNCQ